MPYVWDATLTTKMGEWMCVRCLRCVHETCTSNPDVYGNCLNKNIVKENKEFIFSTKQL